MTSPLRRKRPTTVRGRSTPIWKATRYAWPLAALGLLLVGGVASAQPPLPPNPLPPQVTMPTAPVPTFSHGPAPRVSGGAPVLPHGAGPVEPAAMLQPKPPPPTPADSATSEYEDLLTMPGPERVFGPLESEENFKERMRNRAWDRKMGERLDFPKPPVLAKGRYAGRSWPEMHCTTEPNYVCYQKLLFEQKNFERYGWDLGPITPVVSALTFYTDFWLVPYKLGTDPFRQYECSAGYCMPGDPVPLLLYPPELSVTGALAEAAGVLALVAIFP